MTCEEYGEMRKILYIMAGVIALTTPTFAQAPTQRVPWSDIARTDIAAIKKLLSENHPGAVDPENREFAHWLVERERQALLEASSARNVPGYRRAVRSYANRFRDMHVELNLASTPGQMVWPGFMIGPDNAERPQVGFTTDPHTLPKGAKLLDCDGKTFDALMQERVQPYFWNNDIPHMRGHHFWRLFYLPPSTSFLCATVVPAIPASAPAAEATILNSPADVSTLNGVVAHYEDGFKRGNLESFLRVFSPDAYFFWLKPGGEAVEALPIASVLPGWAARPDATARVEIINVQLTSPMLAFISLRLHYAGRVFSDQLNLLKAGGEWMIVAKLSTL
jgi:hypothetical protein